MKFAYLFERFPTFSQTFCVREVVEMRRQAGDVPVFSIRTPSGEPKQDFPEEATRYVTYLPADIEAALRDEPAPAATRIRRRWELWRRADQSDRKRFFEALWLGPVLRERGIGHVHVHFAGMGARTAFWLNKLFGITFSITAHANDFFVGANEKSPVGLADLFRSARHVATVSDFSKTLLQARFPDDARRIVRVYNGIEPARFAGPRHPASPPLILAVGRYIEKKGFRDLIAACAMLPDLLLECRIMGEGPLEAELRALVESLGQQDRVRIAGPAPEGEIIGLLHRSTLFALPCVTDSKGDSDNLPTVIMEAMAAGLPVVSTPVAGVPEMVSDGITGWLAPEHSPEALAAKIRSLLENDSLCQSMGAAGTAKCRDLFDVRKTCGELHRILADA
ncbi:MAG: glycosyltransferase family 4 protein [Verrucomicrobia bacterium]|nr:glycosyltransferase family 4 protein [Verrucomicrobiota bacterium]